MSPTPFLLLAPKVPTLLPGLHFDNPHRGIGTGTAGADTANMVIVNAPHIDQRATLVGLGIRRMHQVVEVEDSPSVRGMIAKVSHLVVVLED